MKHYHALQTGSHLDTYPLETANETEPADWSCGHRFHKDLYLWDTPENSEYTRYCSDALHYWSIAPCVQIFQVLRVLPFHLILGIRRANTQMAILLSYILVDISMQKRLYYFRKLVRTYSRGSC